MVEPQSEVLRRLLAYWQRKKGDRPAPIRADIDPLEIKPLLPYVGLVDVERSPLRFRFRLTGTEITKGYGQELTGRYLDEIDLNNHQLDIMLDYARAAENGEAACSTLEYMRNDGRHLRYERLVLPLSSDGGKVDMLIGGCVFDWSFG